MHFTKALASRRPDVVSHAISMGSDLHGMFGISSPTRAAVGIARNAMRVTRSGRHPTCFRSGCSCAFVRDFRADFPHDRACLTSIYSRGDGVVRQILAGADCIEVTGSHIGLMANRKAYEAIAYALSLAELELADAL